MSKKQPNSKKSQKTEFEMTSADRSSYLKGVNVLEDKYKKLKDQNSELLKKFKKLQAENNERELELIDQMERILGFQTCVEFYSIFLDDRELNAEQRLAEPLDDLTSITNYIQALEKSIESLPQSPSDSLEALEELVNQEELEVNMLEQENLKFSSELSLLKAKLAYKESVPISSQTKDIINQLTETARNINNLNTKSASERSQEIEEVFQQEKMGIKRVGSNRKVIAKQTSLIMSDEIALTEVENSATKMHSALENKWAIKSKKLIELTNKFHEINQTQLQIEQLTSENQKLYLQFIDFETNPDTIQKKRKANLEKHLRNSRKNLSSDIENSKVSYQEKKMLLQDQKQKFSQRWKDLEPSRQELSKKEKELIEYEMDVLNYEKQLIEVELKLNSTLKKEEELFNQMDMSLPKEGLSIHENLEEMISVATVVCEEKTI